MSSLPTDPFAFKSAALQASGLKSTVNISSTGATSSNTSSSTALPSAAAMFEAFAQQQTNTPTDTTKSPIDTKNQANNTTITQNTPSQFRGGGGDSDNDDDHDYNPRRGGFNNNNDQNNDNFQNLHNPQNSSNSFDVFKVAQEHVDHNLFQKAFQSLDVTAIHNQREAIDLEKKSTLEDSLETNSLGMDNDWLQFLNAFDQEVAKVEDDIKKQQEIELQNSIALIGDAIKNNTTISLPTQSIQSRELTDHLTKLYAEFSEKRKNKEVQRQQRKFNVNNTVGLKPQNQNSNGQNQNSAKSRLNNNKKAANKAMNRFDKLDAMASMTPQDREQQKRRQGNGQIDFLQDAGPYKKQSQANKKKGKKLDW